MANMRHYLTAKPGYDEPGFALKYAELQPLSCVSYADAVALREKEATPILLQIRNGAPLPFPSHCAPNATGPPRIPRAPRPRRRDPVPLRR